MHVYLDGLSLGLCMWRLPYNSIIVVIVLLLFVHRMSKTHFVMFIIIMHANKAFWPLHQNMLKWNLESLYCEDAEKRKESQQTTLGILHGTRPAVLLACVVPKWLQVFTQCTQCSVWYIACVWKNVSSSSSVSPLCHFCKSCEHQAYVTAYHFPALLSATGNTTYNIHSHQAFCAQFWAQVVVPPTTRITFNAMRSPKPVLRLTCLIWRGVKQINNIT